MTITLEDYTALKGISFTGALIFLHGETEFPSEEVVTKCIGADLAAEVKRYRGKWMPYSLLVTVLEKGCGPGASAELYAPIFYLLFMSSAILSNRSERVDPSLIPFARNLSAMGSFCWSDPTYANLIIRMSKDVRF